jgi:hypothetical protein
VPTIPTLRQVRTIRSLGRLCPDLEPEPLEV